MVLSQVKFSVKNNTTGNVRKSLRNSENREHFDLITSFSCVRNQNQLKSSEQEKKLQNQELITVAVGVLSD